MPLQVKALKQRRKRTPSRRSREVLGSVLVALGIFMFISLWMQGGPAGSEAGDTGVVGDMCVRALVAFAGGGAWVIAASLFLVGLDLILEGIPSAIARRASGILVLSLAIIAFLELSFPGRGGVWGAVATSVITPLVGRVGGHILLAALCVVTVVVMLEASIGSLVRLLGRGLLGSCKVAFHWSWSAASFLRGVVARAIIFLFEEGEKGEAVEGEATESRSAGRPARGAACEPASGLDGDLPEGKVRVVGAALPGAPGAYGHDAETPVSSRIKKSKDSARSASQPIMVSSSGQGTYSLPSTNMLKYIPAKRQGKGSPDLVARAKLLEETLGSFGVRGQVLQVSCGPVVTRYEFHPGPGITVSKITSLANDIALALAAAGVRIEAPIPGKSAVGIEVPNEEPVFVSLREVIESPAFQKSPSKLTIAFGKDIAGNVVTGDLKQMLHLLVAGATGSGKSVCLNCLIASILFKARPEEVKLLMIDPKRVELSTYDGIPHLLAPVVTDTREAAGYLWWVAGEMDRRYKLLERAGVRNIEKYNELYFEGKLPEPDPDTEEAETGWKPLPYIVVIIDELGDLMLVAQKEVEDVISQLAFMARAAGIHLVVATQRPSRDVVTGIIKMNIPSRIAFAVPAGVDSRVILDMNGAERLLGKGDMLFFPIGAPKPLRVQGAYVSDGEIEALVNFVRSQGEPHYEAECITVGSGGDAGENLGEEDSLFEEACKLIIETQEASISKLQRRFRIGYSRAARLIDAMEQRGIVGPYEGSKPRKVLVGQDKFGRQDGGRRI